MREEFPGNCGLDIVAELYCIVGEDEYSTEQRRILGAEMKEHKVSVLTITDEVKSDFKKMKAFVERRGYKLLGTYPGVHRAGYKVYFYGSKEFKMPRRNK